MSTYQQLSNEELIALIQQEDEAAKEYFVEKNQGLVYSCIQRFVTKRTSKEDLFQIACIGLMKALNNFDLSLGLQFSTYAIPIMLGEIKRYFRDEGSVRISRSIKENYLVLRGVREELMQKLQREPTYQEIAIQSGYASEDVLIAFEANQFVSSIDEVLIDHNGSSMVMGERFAKKSSDENLRIALNQEISKLSVQEQLLIYYRFTLGYRQKEIAEKIGLSQVQVSRMEKLILRKLKDKFSI